MNQDIKSTDSKRSIWGSFSWRIYWLQNTSWSPLIKITYNSGFEVDKHRPGDVVTGARLAEEGAEGVVMVASQLVWRHGTVGLDAVFQAVQFPAGIADLDSSLTHVDADALTL